MIRRVTLLLLCALGFVASAAVAVALGASLAGGVPPRGPFPKLIPDLVVGFSVLVALRYSFLIALAFIDVLIRRPLPRYPDGEWPLVAVIVPVYKERDLIEKTLQSLAELQYPGKYRVVVVIDGEDKQLDGTPGLIRMFQEERPDERFAFIQKPNGGKSSALNLGLAEAKKLGATLALCVDGDTILAPDTLELMAVHFIEEGVVACAGQVRVRNWIRGTGVGEHGYPFWETLQALEYVVGHGFLRRAQSALRAVAIIPGPCGMFRISVLDEISAAVPPFVKTGQPSHPEHGPYEYDTLAEDCDLTLALLRRAWRRGHGGITYEPRAIALTDGRGKLADLFRQRYRWLRGVLAATLKHMRRWWTDADAEAGEAAPFPLPAALIAVATIAGIVGLGLVGRLPGALAFLAALGVASAVTFFQWARTDRQPESLLLLAYMVFETLLWPIFSVLGIVVLVEIAFFEPVNPVLVLVWFAALTSLDVLAAAFSVLVEGADPLLIPFSILSKPLYVLAMDACKVAALVDVVFLVRAVWHDRYTAPVKPAA